jgi:cystathionine beta-lyase/cystathionine gamma-synthase
MGERGATFDTSLRASQRPADMIGIFRPLLRVTVGIDDAVSLPARGRAK